MGLKTFGCELNEFGTFHATTQIADNGSEESLYKLLFILQMA